MVKATSTLMSTNKTQTWSELSKKDQRESAELILQGVESSAFVFAKAIESPDTINKKEDNIGAFSFFLYMECLKNKTLGYYCLNKFFTLNYLSTFYFYTCRICQFITIPTKTGRDSIWQSVRFSSGRSRISPGTSCTNLSER